MTETSGIRSEPTLVSALSAEILEQWSGLRFRLDEGSTEIGDAIEQLAALGLLGATIECSVLGRAASIAEILEVVRLVAQHCGVLGRVIVDANLGPTAIVAVRGSERIKHDLLESCRRGEKLAIAISEREAGSDVRSMRTCIRWADDSMGRLDGEKVWITGAPRSTRYVVFAKSEWASITSRVKGGEHPENESASRVASEADIVVLYVPAGRSGLGFGEVPTMMGMRGLPEGTVCFDGVEVTSDDVLIGFDGLKQGMKLYNTQRLGAAMVAIGVAEGALLRAMGRLRTRFQFGCRIGEHQGLRWEFAQQLAELVSARITVERCAVEAEGFFVDPSLVAVAKLRAAAAAKAATDFAIQAFGADGYRVDRGIEALWRDVRMFEIGGGTREMLLDLVGRRALEGSATLISTIVAPGQ